MGREETGGGSIGADELTAAAACSSHFDTASRLPGGTMAPSRRSARFHDAKANLDLLGHGISFTRKKSRGLDDDFTGPARLFDPGGVAKNSFRLEDYPKATCSRRTF